jgi:hypothetical protein
MARPAEEGAALFLLQVPVEMAAEDSANGLAASGRAVVMEGDCIARIAAYFDGAQSQALR